MMRGRALRARGPPAQAEPGHEDRRLRPLIIAVIAAPLPPGAARRIAGEVLLAVCRGGEFTHEQRQLALALEGDDDGASKR